MYLFCPQLCAQDQQAVLLTSSLPTKVLALLSAYLIPSSKDRTFHQSLLCPTKTDQTLLSGTSLYYTKYLSFTAPITVVI